jgi:hypothetical protein
MPPNIILILVQQETQQLLQGNLYTTYAFHLRESGRRFNFTRGEKHKDKPFRKTKMHLSKIIKAFCIFYAAELHGGRTP